MSIMHIINDYTNQISKYVDVEYGLSQTKTSHVSTNFVYGKVQPCTIICLIQMTKSG